MRLKEAGRIPEMELYDLIKEIKKMARKKCTFVDLFAENKKGRFGIKQTTKNMTEY